MKWIPRITALLLLWGGMGAIVVYIDPLLLRDWVIPRSYLPFFILLGVTLWYTIRSFWIAITILLGIVLSTIGVMHWGLALALLLTLVSESWYIYHSHEKTNSVHEPKNRNTGL